MDTIDIKRHRSSGTQSVSIKVVHWMGVVGWMPDANGAKMSETEIPGHGSLSASWEISSVSCDLSSMQESKHPFADRNARLSLGLRRQPLSVPWR